MAKEDQVEVQEYEGPPPAPLSGAFPGLYTKLVAVMASLEGLAPQGSNRHFSYNYWETNQVTGVFRPLFVRHGLSFMSDVVDFDIRPRGEKSLLTSLKVLFTITDIETGETISGHGFGQGDDAGDKGANKAFAGALKYWLLKTFLVGGDDAEADERTDRRASRDDARSVTVSDSEITGIARGGRSTNATDVQVKRIRTLAADNKFGAGKTADLIEDILNVRISLPEDPEEIGPAFVRYLEGMGADDAGKVIQYMEKMSDDVPDEGTYA